MQRDAISENAKGEGGSLAGEEPARAARLRCLVEYASAGYLLYDEDGTAQGPVSSWKRP